MEAPARVAQQTFDQPTDQPTNQTTNQTTNQDHFSTLAPQLEGRENSRILPHHISIPPCGPRTAIFFVFLPDTS